MYTIENLCSRKRVSKIPLESGIMQNLNLLTLACGCVCVVAGSAYAAGYSPRVGEPHPDFVLPGIADCQPVSLSQFRGKKVLLVHFASW